MITRYIYTARDTGEPIGEVLIYLSPGEELLIDDEGVPAGAAMYRGEQHLDVEYTVTIM